MIDTESKDIFPILKAFISEMNGTNSVKVKKEILFKYPRLDKILDYVYNPFKKYYITTKQLKKHKELCSDKYITNSTTIYEVLDKLTSREVTGYDAIGMVNYFISNNKDYEDLIKLILDKDLKCRVGASIINKVFSKLIPQFKVALAEEYDESMSAKEDWNWADWLVLRKLDGIRCICVIDKNGDVKFYSRQGKEFHTLGKIEKEIKAHNLRDMVLDGELCIVDEEGKENFKLICEEYRKKNHTIKNPKYILFDLLTLKEFEDGISDTTYWERVCRLASLYKLSPTLEIIHFWVNTTEREFPLLREKAIKNNWEGLILRKANSPYEAKRTKNILKVKSFFDDEYIVEDIEIGPFRVINKDTGLEEIIEILTNVIISHKGHKVSVGSGFSIDERKYYSENPEKLIGKEITVKYFEETTNRNGGISLRFPTIKKIWENRRDV